MRVGSKVWGAALLSCLLLLWAPPASGQIALGVAGGPVFPLGDLDARVQNGLHGGVVLDVAVPLLPVGLRADAMFQRLPGRGERAAYSQVWGTVNARVGLPLPVLSFYVTGGLGLYRSDFPATEGAPESGNTHGGLNAGVGVRANLLLIRAFAEARYHRVGSEPARGFAPLTVGVTF